MQVHNLSQPLPAFRNAVVTIGGSKVTLAGVKAGQIKAGDIVAV